MIGLGDKVKDTVSGLVGIAISRHHYLHGCTRIGVQGAVGKDGKLPDIYFFDEPQLKIVKAGCVLPGKTDTGGPMPHTPTARAVDDLRR